MCVREREREVRRKKLIFMTCTRKRLIFFSSFIYVPEAYFLRSMMHLVAVRTRLHSGDEDKDLHYLVQQSY